MKKDDTGQYKMKLLAELSRHVGELHAIGMAELYEAVFGEGWQHRINDTKKLRELVTELRFEGIPICSVSKRQGGGYYLAAAKTNSPTIFPDQSAGPSGSSPGTPGLRKSLFLNTWDR